jgi:hypothetical protein
MSTLENNDSCQHTQYCALSKSICTETGFKEKCLMKDSLIEQMPLLKKVKERVQKDKMREDLELSFS